MSDSGILKSYIREICGVAKPGDAREESYYDCLKRLFLDYCAENKHPKAHVTAFPKKTEAGNPDFRVWDGEQHIIGYIEAKSPQTIDLDSIEDTEQLERYRKSFPNLILTNFLEFRLYRNGEMVSKCLIARPFVIHKLKSVPVVEKASEFHDLLERFFSFQLPKITDAKSLAVELAKKTRFLRDEVIIEELKEKNGSIDRFYEAFKNHLISGLTKDEFADLYSQTIAYGLFASRMRSENGFNRRLAFDNIPQTIGILRDLFRFISLEDPPTPMQWTIDDLAEVLAATDVKNILHQFFGEGKGSDPIIHFYETFLSEYDPKTREKRGVYYTPEPVVLYIVRSINKILKERFNQKDGFANDSVTVLDPAAGTLTFLAETSKLAVQEFIEKYGDGAKRDFIKNHILKDFYAFELMVAPYAVGHLKMSFLLEELGYKLQKDDGFKLYLTNTLEMEELTQTEIPGMASLSVESHKAAIVKKDTPILVILGNPPYSGHSANASEKIVLIKDKYNKIRKRKIKTWIGGLIEDYKRVDGQPLGEKNPKWLQDDYVKFIRFAQWKIDQAGKGILGFITNHGYLDNPTFRGMRQSLMNSFDEIYILDLHGNSNKKEKCPDGSKDENVFDIQQGVAIAIFIKYPKALPPSPRRRGAGGEVPIADTGGEVPIADTGGEVLNASSEVPKEASIFHSELWGLRENKYEWLKSNEVNTTQWKNLSPKSDYYLFIPHEEKLAKIYDNFTKITDIFPINSVGIVTARDDLVIDTDKEALKRRIRMLIDNKAPDELVAQTFDLRDKSNWNLSKARKLIRNNEDWEKSITRILYRPFDMRWLFYDDSLVERTRKAVMRHMLHENIGLITVRQVAEGIFNHAFISNGIIESRTTLSNKGIAYLFPLYLYADEGELGDLTPNPSPGRRGALGARVRNININPKLLNTLSSLPSPHRRGAGGEVLIPGIGGEVPKGPAGAVMKGQIPPYIKELARKLRREATETEDILWQALRNSQLDGLKFRRQHPFGRYIADFYCHEAGLIIEIDGGVHAKSDQKEYDKIRQEELESRGIKVLRIKTDEFQNDLEKVLCKIADAAQENMVRGEIEPETVFYYIYAVLYSNTYREKYAEFLKIDFPRIPFTNDSGLFAKMAEYGRRLANLHLLKSDELEQSSVRYQGSGNNLVEILKYDETRGKVFINSDQYFEGISPEIWNYQIGGYKVCEKWLKERKKRKLSLDDIKHYCSIITALQISVKIQSEIDKIYPQIEENLANI